MQGGPASEGAEAEDRGRTSEGGEREGEERAAENKERRQMTRVKEKGGFQQEGPEACRSPARKGGVTVYLRVLANEKQQERRRRQNGRRWKGTNDFEAFQYAWIASSFSLALSRAWASLSVGGDRRTSTLSAVGFSRQRVCAICRMGGD